ncbi:uncharacterized protein [Watersipora subatra]|uniref:uncharacterized protein n=1 Tax=Watersipora subatra TaxID=2589382 RepID=UPI00355C64BB
MKEELLTLVGLEGKTTGQATYDALDNMKILFYKCISATTDGAPAMVGRDQGVIAKLKKGPNPFLNTCTCLNARQFQEMMSSFKDMSDLAFLVDICGHLNGLNLKLQGKNKTIINTLPAVQAFSHKLELFLVDVQGDMLPFPTRKALLDDKKWRLAQLSTLTL